MARSEYIQQCIDLIGGLDITQLENAKLDNEIGHGGRSRVLALGTIGTMPVCIKILTGSDEPTVRLANELKCAAIISNRAPELQKLFPAFLGILAVKERHEPVALITEDVSQGGRIPVQAMPASATSYDSLRAGLPDVKARGLIRPEQLNETVAFSVAGQERWLDMTPSPLILWPARGTELRTEFDGVGQEVRDSMADLTCTVNPASALAQSIEAYL